MDHTKSPNYFLNDQIYESSDKTIKIFKTRKKQTITYLAVKVYHKKMHDNYSYEYNILKNMVHPNIVRCQGYSEDYNYFYMELEYCMTGDLSRCLWQNKNTHYTEKIVKHVSTQILLSLQYLHKNGILHCNLKPSNILVDEYGNIRLCDFKKSLRVNSISSNDIKKNKAAMTPCYTAPELFSEDGCYNYKTDLWALGCIMYELAVGQVPFFDESVRLLISKIINDDVNFNRKELQNFSDEFIDILRRLLEKDPNSRISWNEIEKHNFWEFDLGETIEEIKPSTQRQKSGRSIGSAHNDKKKAVDILRLSRNALQNMMDERDDEYSREKNKAKEVDNADQEFKFEGNDEKKNDDYDSEKTDKEFKPLKANNPLEISLMNVTRNVKKDKRKKIENLEKSIVTSTDLPTFETIMIHPSDKIIKPIIGNKTIEIISPTTFNKNKLHFPAWKLEKIKELCRNENTKLMESYLYNIYSSMEQYFSKNDDDGLINILNYFESVIQDKEIANNIINTSFITLMINILQKSKSDLVKIRVCSIIAYLIRYSTVIENPLDKLGLTKILELLAREKNSELSKKAVATLGEYLFFVTTQAEGEEESSLYWKISDDSLNTLLYTIENSKDDVIRFYAIKAIENITALTNVAKLYFTKDDSFVLKILEVFNKTKNPDLKISSIYTVSHLIRLEPRLLESFLEMKSLPELKKNLEEENPKIQQALLNCILFGIYSESKIFIKNEFFINFCLYLISFLDISQSIIKMKIIMIFSLVLEDAYAISKFGEKLFHNVLKLKKDNNNEIQIVIKIFEQIIINKIKTITKNFISCRLFNKSTNSNLNSYNSYEELSNYLNIFSTLSNYPKLMSNIYTQEVLECLIKIILDQDIYDEKVIKNVYEILKIFSENHLSIYELSEFIIKRMFIQILKSSFNIKLDNIILPLNIAANLITNLLDEEKLYSSTVLEDGKTKMINIMIIQSLPIIRDMLKVEGLVYSVLSFLSLIVERNSAFIKYYKSEGIIDYIFDLMNDLNFYNNLNIIKIFTKLIEFQETTFDDIINMNLIEKVNSLIFNDNGDNAIFTEYIIELFYYLMYKINEQKKLLTRNNLDKDEFKKFTNKIEAVAKNFRLCIKLIGYDNINIQEKSCVSLIFLLQLFPDTYVESVCVHVKFFSTDIPELLKGLELCCSKIHKRMIRIFVWIIAFQNDAAQVLKPYISYLVSYIENICNTSNDQEIVQLANQLINVELKNLNIK